MEDASRWDVPRVGVWLEGLGLGHLVGEFRNNKVDGKLLVSLEKADLKDELEVAALSDRKLLWDRIETLKKGGASTPTPVPAASATAKAGTSPKTGYSSSPASRPASSATTTEPKERDSPMYVPARSAPTASDKCEHCRKLFGISDVPVMLTLPGAARAARLHRACKETWAYNNAKLCKHCKKPMTVDVTVLTGGFGKAEVHPECVGAYERRHGGSDPARSPAVTPAQAVFDPAAATGSCEHCHRRFTVADNAIKLTLPGASRAAELHPACKQLWSETHAKRCDFCHEPMPTDITTLTGAFGTAEVHPTCVGLYESRLRGEPTRPAKKSPSAGPSRSPKSTPSTSPKGASKAGSGRCEHCHKQFTDYDDAILLTLPGAARAAELHAHCKTSWSREHAKKCAFCHEAMIRDITTLSGRWGTAELHPDCVKGYENLNLHTKGTNERCSHCHRAFKDGEVANVVTLPGDQKTGKLHTECQNAWMLMQAKLCEHCSKPMPTDVTTLSGTWGEADMHPECVKGFKESLARGVAPRKKSPQQPPSISPRGASGSGRVSPMKSPRSDTGKTYDGKMENRCYQCRKTFLASEAVTVLSVSGLFVFVFVFLFLTRRIPTSIKFINALTNNTTHNRPEARRTPSQPMHRRLPPLPWPRLLLV